MKADSAKYGKEWKIQRKRVQSEDCCRAWSVRTLRLADRSNPATDFGGTRSGAPGGLAEPVTWLGSTVSCFPPDTVPSKPRSKPQRDAVANGGSGGSE